MNFIKKFWNNFIGTEEVKVKVAPKKVADEIIEEIEEK